MRKAWWVALFLSTACGGGRPAPGPTGPASPTGAADAGTATAPAPTRPGVRLKVEPADAQLFVDGTPRDFSRGGVVALEPGLHQLMVSRSGFQTWRGEVTVGESVELLDIKLVKAEPGH